MNIPCLLLCAGIGLSVAFADVETHRAEALGKPMASFRTMEGRVYHDVVITKINEGGVSFKHTDGAARLRFSELSPGQRKYFGIEKEEAAEFYRKEAERQTAYEKLVAKQEQKRRILAETRAKEREDAKRITSAAEAKRIVNAPQQPEATIPPYPTIQRVDTRVRSSRSYGFSYRPHFSGFRSFTPRFNYGSRHRGGFHYRGYSRSTPSVIYRR